jgi:UDP:flavonoid glycosyltransferase YjiC (YdhE family)
MKIGFVSIPVAGHLNPMTALGRKLKSRGHEVVFICLPDAEPAVRAAKTGFRTVLRKRIPGGRIQQTVE